MHIFPLVYLFAATASPSLNVGTMPWATFPSIPISEGRFDGWGGRQGLLDILSKKQCNLPGVTRDNFNNLEVWYAMEVAPDGTVSRIVIESKNCRPLESLVGAMVMQLIKTNKIKAPSGEDAKWFGSRIRFVS